VYCPSCPVGRTLARGLRLTRAQQCAVLCARQRERQRHTKRQDSRRTEASVEASSRPGKKKSSCRYKPGAFFRAKYGVSAPALRGWASSGRLDYTGNMAFLNLSSLIGAEDIPEEAEAAARFVRDRLGRYFQVLPRQVARRSETQAPSSHEGVVALDPGVRTKDVSLHRMWLHRRP
jgi:hypothetical protein